MVRAQLCPSTSCRMAKRSCPPPADWSRKINQLRLTKSRHEKPPPTSNALKNWISAIARRSYYLRRMPLACSRKKSTQVKGRAFSPPFFGTPGQEIRLIRRYLCYWFSIKPCRIASSTLLQRRFRDEPSVMILRRHPQTRWTTHAPPNRKIVLRSQHGPFAHRRGTA